MLKRTLLSLLLAGVLSPLPAVYAEVSLFSKTEIGDCIPQIDGQVDSLTINCHNSTIPEAALKSLESSLKEMVVKRMEQMRTPEEVEKLMADLREEIASWEKRYHELEASIQAGLVTEPDNERLKEADAALKQGDFEKAAKILEELADKQEKEVDKAADYQYRAGQALQLAFKPQKALEHLKKAYQYRPENETYAFDYSLLLQKQNQRNEAEQVYIALLKQWKAESTLNNAKIAGLLNNLAALIDDDTHRRNDAESLYNEALTLRRQLAKDNPNIYLPHVAMTLNNLATLVDDDTQRRNDAESLYNEALTIYRQLAKQNPNVYLPDVAMTLNNLANLVSDDAQRRKDAETLYNEALTLHRQLAKDNPNVYLPDIAITLNNLANLVSDDAQRRKDAETLYNEALTLHRQLAKNNPNVYLPHVAGILNNLAALFSDDTQRRKDAETLYNEALALYRQLVKDNPNVYLPYVAMTLSNLAALMSQDTQGRKKAETFYNEVLTLRRQLAEDNPNVYLPDLASTLGNYGVAHLNWNDKEKAFVLLKEATEILSPLAQQYPNIYGDKQARNLFSATEASQDKTYICQAMQEAVQVVQTREDIKQKAEKAIAFCKQEGILK
ncbi:MAG: tetratricopeptide repeat protein [Thiofilum sp.]|uniref:tetratricopeptide repeat protein n=1 Tax=Thiofilum sp. TaxID=2212733 RepID=UPI0025DD4793|nr:tetratricopeptide repeat protein [Thiofilum sp.]MBK8454910.1 tetratricopeptide repeat protein [Thiofilum sp.]